MTRTEVEAIIKTARERMERPNLSWADLSGADLDYSCWPLWCGSLLVKVDKRIAAQIAYHFCYLGCEDPEYIQARNAILPLANQFHRVEEGGVLKEISVPEQSDAAR